MANIAYDITEIEFGGVMLVPYVGTGAGLAVNKISDITVTGNNASGRLEGSTKANFAWQVEGGIGIKLSETLMLDASYRYVDLGKFQSDLTILETGNEALEPLKGDFKTHEVVLGLRYGF